VLELAGLSANEYEVLWLQGGGRMQFAMIPMNFLDSNATAGYIDSGYWAHDALETAKLYGNVDCLASSRNINYQSLPILDTTIPKNLAYLHLTTNNTIYGTQLKSVPECSVPLFADMSSDIFSEQRDYARFDLFYAVAQKNLGAAGVTLVVLRKDLLPRIVRKLPPILDYHKHVLNKSVLNTPPIFSIYVSLLQLRWTKSTGLNNVYLNNIRKSALLYNEIDRNTLFQATVRESDRSKMNVVFNAINKETEVEFLMYAKANNIVGIEGHRSVGGFRVSLYNAITIEQVQKLIRLLHTFEEQKANNN
jgi:phosphoserine aminotransferase